MPDKAIDIRKALRIPIPDSLYCLIKRPLEHICSVNKFNEHYRKFTEESCLHDNLSIFQKLLEYLDIGYELNDEGLVQIPEQGPLITVSNHPFGCLDGLILGSILCKRRKDIKFLVNDIISFLQLMDPWSIKVDRLGDARAQKANIRPLLTALRHIRSGGALGLFPSGIVSHAKWRSFKVTDPKWDEGLGQLIRRSGATIVPIYFDGSNSVLFQAAGLVHPSLRVLLLLRELFNKMHSTVTVRIGRPVSPERLTQFENPKKLIDYLRLKTYLLKSTIPPKPTPPRPSLSIPQLFCKKNRKQQPLIAPIPQAVLAAEIDALPDSACLLSYKHYTVYVTEASAIPQTLREIGRLREQSFRGVQDGTGLSCDLDRFDSYYKHLFLWNGAQRNIIGAYRIGRVQPILNRYGPKGLYPSTLYRFKEPFFEKIGNALELGRSFIIKQYQRDRNSLSLLWRGIGEYIARHPQHTILIGPVGISRAYLDISRELMVAFLKQHNLDSEFASLVRAKYPPTTSQIKHLCNSRNEDLPFSKIKELSNLISEIETDNKGIPVLLRHYLKLNGVLLSFDVDPNFNDSITGLILVDLLKSDPKFLKCSMGKTTAQQFLDHHHKMS